jgi:hypothetical protein
MDWKQDLGALIETTMTFAKDVKDEPIPDILNAIRTAEQVLAEASKPTQSRAVISPIVWPTSERDEILEHVSKFRAHQEKMAREREDYYLQAKAMLLASLAKRN